MSFETYYRQQQDAETSRRLDDYNRSLIDNVTRRDAFVGEPNYKVMAANAAAGYVLGSAIRNLFRGLFGR